MSQTKRMAGSVSEGLFSRPPASNKPESFVRVKVSRELHNSIAEAARLSRLGFEEWIIVTCEHAAKYDIEFHKLPSPGKAYIGERAPDVRWPGTGESD